MPYYTFKIPSLNKNVLAKHFSSRDCIDLHFLLANEDFEGVNLFCEKKFVEYTGCTETINSLDKFLFLFSQKILSHSFDINVNHVSTNESKTTIKINLVRIYNSISDSNFITKQTYKDKDLEIEYGIPLNLSNKEHISLYTIKINGVAINIDNSLDYKIDDLPVEMFKQVNKMLLKNNEMIKSDYFKSGFLRDLELSNSCFLFFLDFIFTENVASFFNLKFNLSKEYNINYEYIETISMRELQLLVDTINTNNQEKKKQQKANE